MGLVLLVGGARSGKSQLALRLAERQSAPVVFIATAEAGDEEMGERIERHRRERPASWRTVEEPFELQHALKSVPAQSCVVLDCLTLWVANAIDRLDPAEVEAQAATAARTAALRKGLTVVVTNEVGFGIVPVSELGRAYRDLLGRVNTIWADAAERALLLVAGRAVELTRTDAFPDELS